MIDNTKRIRELAVEIETDWTNISVYAKPYLDAMLDGAFGLDGAEDIVLRFLCNAQAWRGPMAKYVKAQLKALKF